MKVHLSSDKARSSIKRLLESAALVTSTIDENLSTNSDPQTVSLMRSHRDLAVSLVSEMTAVSDLLESSQDGIVDMDPETIAAVERFGVIAEIYGAKVRSHSSADDRHRSPAH